MINRKNILFLFFKNNFTRINHCIFTRHKSHLKPLLRNLPCIVCREYFCIIFYVKKCALYLTKYGRLFHDQRFSSLSHSIFVEIQFPGLCNFTNFNHWISTNDISKLLIAFVDKKIDNGCFVRFGDKTLIILTIYLVKVNHQDSDAKITLIGDHINVTISVF